jgi:tetratricopeptide (TPR) repeat protein
MSTEELCQKANAELTSGKYQEAVKTFTAAIALDPNNHLLYANRFAAYAGLNDYTNAEKDADLCIDKKNDWYKGYCLLGDARRALKKLDAAIQVYSCALQYTPEEKKADVYAMIEAVKEDFKPKNSAPHSSLLVSFFSDRRESTSRRDDYDSVFLELFKDFSCKRTEKSNSGYCDPPFDDSTERKKWTFNGKWKFNKADGNIEIALDPTHTYEESDSFTNSAGNRQDATKETKTERREVEKINIEEYFKTGKGFGYQRADKNEVIFCEGGKEAVLEFLQKS